MNDTSPEMEQRFRELLMRKSGEERLIMGAEMFDTAKQMALAGMGLDEKEPLSGAVRRKLFERIYGQEFPATQRTIIGQWLEGAGS